MTINNWVVKCELGFPPLQNVQRHSKKNGAIFPDADQEINKYIVETFGKYLRKYQILMYSSCTKPRELANVFNEFLKDNNRNLLLC